eukprot:scaffold280797_cov35-Tisochrysis_lutea.AAC.2
MRTGTGCRARLLLTASHAHAHMPMPAPAPSSQIALSHLLRELRTDAYGYGLERLSELLEALVQEDKSEDVTSEAALGLGLACACCCSLVAG